VPSFIDPGKPEPPAVAFRKAVFGDAVGAGRPTTIVGDFFYDFGFVGILVGSMLLGVGARGLLGLVSGRKPSGFAVGLYALSMVVLYQLVIGTYSIALGSLLTLVMPYAIAGLVLGRAPSRYPALRRVRLRSLQGRDQQ
jgi:hypothetical protein